MKNPEKKCIMVMLTLIIALASVIMITGCKKKSATPPAEPNTTAQP